MVAVHRLSPVLEALFRTIDARGFIVGRSEVKTVAEHDGSSFLPGLGGWLALTMGRVKLASGKFFGFLRHLFQDIGSGAKY